MAYSVIQQAEGSSTSSGISTIATAAFGSAVTAGNQIVVFVATGAASSKTITVSRGSDTVTAAGTVFYNAAQSYEIQAFVIGSAAAGTTAVTANFSGAINDPSILAIECSGLTNTVAGSKYAEQDSPGTGADGVTSGNTGTLTTQPCAVFGLGYDITQVAAAPPTAGTGFTSLTACWAFGGGVAWARPEHKRVTATTALPSTFTASDGGSSFMLATVAIAELTGNNVSMTGQTATASQGTMTAGVSVALTALTVTATQGTFSVGNAGSLTGQTVTVSQGTFTASNSAPLPYVRSAPPAPLTASKALGPFGLGGFALKGGIGPAAAPSNSASITGSTVTASQGTMTAGVSVTLNGLSVTSSQGSLAPAGTNTVTLTGQTVTATQGTLGAAIAVTLAGSTVTSTQGTMTISGVTVVTLNGQTVSITQGAFSLPGSGGASTGGGSFDSLTPGLGLTL